MHDQTWFDDWSIWSKAVGRPLQDAKAGSQFSLYSLAVEEAKAGAGVLMGHMCLLEGAMAEGSLVAACEPSCDTGRSLIVSVPKGARQRPETAKVVALMSEG